MESLMNFQVIPGKPWVTLLATASAIWACYIFGLAIYRLYFSPIAKFPGPKLAALTKWYECYWEIVRNGRFTFHIQDLHEKYGPIIRITPDELHILDSDYYEQLYANSGRLDKYEWMAGRFGTAESFFNSGPDKLHRLRRAPLNPFFSKKRIVEFQPVIREKLEKLCRKIAQFNGREFHLHKAWSAWVGDVIAEYSFARSYDHLDIPDFTETFHEPMHAASETGLVTLQFPWMWVLMNNLPDWLVLKLNPLLALIFKCQRDFKKQIIAIREGENESHKTADHPTIFHELLRSDLPPEELTPDRLFQEAQSIIGGGVLTTGWALTVASFHIIDKPEIFRRLRAELEEAIPNPDRIAELDWLKLEQLPYLSAVIREGIRLAYAVTSRSPRLSPKPLQYNEWTIPARTPVSMSMVDMVHDEAIYPSSHSFIPDRWLDNPKTSSGIPLERYWAGFGKGTRSCIGRSLADAELYLGLAAVFRKFTFELYETDVSDVALAHDHFVASVKQDSKGVRVRVKTVD